MALVGIELVMLVSEPDVLTTRPHHSPVKLENNLEKMLKTISKGTRNMLPLILS